MSIFKFTHHFFSIQNLVSQLTERQRDRFRLGCRQNLARPSDRLVPTRDERIVSKKKRIFKRRPNFFERTRANRLLVDI